MDQDAAGRIAVFRRERAVRRSQDRVRRAGDPEHRKGHRDIVWIESALGCLSSNVLGQPEMPRQGKARRYAESVDTGGFQSRAILAKKVGTNVNPADLTTKPLAKPTI